MYGILLVNECCGTLGTAVNEAYFALFPMGAHVTGMSPGCENSDFYISIDTALGCIYSILLSKKSQCKHFPIH